MRPGRFTLLCIALLSGALAGSERVAAQTTGPLVQFDPARQLIVVVPLDDKFISEMIVGSNPQPGAVSIYFVELNGGLTPGLGCQWIDPLLPNAVACPPPPQVRGLRFEPVPQRRVLKLDLPFIELPPAPPLEPLPESLPIEIAGSPKADEIAGSPNTESIDTGKGKDDVNPGGGRDDVNTGAANDEIDTRDGEVDGVNGGAGKRDVATVDKVDKVKNVEVVRRK